MRKVALVMFKDDERREFPLNAKSTIIGRRLDCNLRIPTRDVSRQHCELIVGGDGVVSVKDLGSSNGTYVNGKRIAETRLNPGDKLTVGPVSFIVQIDGKPAQITSADLKATPSGSAAPPAAAPGKPAKPAPKKDELELSEDDLFELDDTDFDLDDDLLKDDDQPKPPPKKK